VFNTDGARRKLGDELVARAQVYFERKAGRPVTPVEAEEWLLSLIDYFAILRRWSENPPSPAGQDVPMVAPDIQCPNTGTSSRANKRSKQAAAVNTPSRARSVGQPVASRVIQEGTR